MNILQFLFYLGIVNIIFGFVWQWVAVVPAALFFALLKFDYGMRLIKLVGTYLLVSLTTILTIIALGSNPNLLAIILYPLIGAFILFMGFANNSYQARKEAQASQDWQMLYRLDEESGFDAIIMIGALILYLVMLFIPAIAINDFTELLYNLIDWIYNLPIIGWIIGLLGIAVLFNTIFQGVFVIAAFAFEFTEKIKTMINGKSKLSHIDNAIKKIDSAKEKQDHCSECGVGVLKSQKYCTQCGAQLKG